MFEWLDGDGALVDSPLSTKAPLRNKRREVQLKGGEGVPE